MDRRIYDRDSGDIPESRLDRDAGVRRLCDDHNAIKIWIGANQPRRDNSAQVPQIAGVRFAENSRWNRAYEFRSQDGSPTTRTGAFSWATTYALETYLEHYSGRDKQ